jgi:hypothetical protein
MTERPKPSRPPGCRRRAEDVERLRRRGLTLAEISTRLGISHQAVHWRLDKIGFPRLWVSGPAKRRPRKPTLAVHQVLAWADAYHARRGRWPHRGSGWIAGSGGETWARIDRALRAGCRGLAGGSSLSRLLAAERGARVGASTRDYSEPLILKWADRHRELKGERPRFDSGAVRGVPGETWHKVNLALCRGLRGLPGGDSLKTLLRRHGRAP